MGWLDFLTNNPITNTASDLYNKAENTIGQWIPKDQQPWFHTLLGSGNPKAAMNPASFVGGAFSGVGQTFGELTGAAAKDRKQERQTAEFQAQTRADQQALIDSLTQRKAQEDANYGNMALARAIRSQRIGAQSQYNPGGQLGGRLGSGPSGYRTLLGS